MANLCNNTLRILGDKEDLERFDEDFKSKPAFMTTKGEAVSFKDDSYLEGKLERYEEMPKDYCFHGIVPMPDEELLKQPLERIDWINKNWGAKQDVYGLLSSSSLVELVIKDEEEYQYDFVTPWSPPINLIKSLTKKYPNMEFTLTYYIDNEVKGGEFAMENGKVMNEIEVDTYKEYRLFLIDYFGFDYQFKCRDCGLFLEYEDFDAYMYPEDGKAGAKCPACESENIYELYSGDEVDPDYLKRLALGDMAKAKSGGAKC